MLARTHIAMPLIADRQEGKLASVGDGGGSVVVCWCWWFACVQKQREVQLRGSFSILHTASQIRFLTSVKEAPATSQSKSRSERSC